MQATLERKKRATPPNPPKVTGELEAKIIALCCSNPPAVKSRWTLRLLANRAVELPYIGSISYDTVDRILKKANVSLTLRNVVRPARAKRGVRSSDGRGAGRVS
ncbi:MAG: helix-turn-helix domain-containing protein [Roseiflexus sp.]|uniref:helix-turn-helix domain-containing protein n=1 Tax=Roseiflexus sp. TaxID=2562120 RepID=UPI00345B3265|nr:helix-turn-helix domain-containing protein [Roseiflexus sp.]